MNLKDNKYQNLDLTDCLKTLRKKVNENFEKVKNNLGLLDSAICKVSDNTYIAKLMKAILDVKSATVNGEFYAKFSDKNTDGLRLSSKGVQITSYHDIANIESERGFIYTISSAAQNAYIDLTSPELYNAMPDDEVICIRIDDNASIYAEIKVNLIGFNSIRSIKLTPDIPSVTLMKVHDSSAARFVVLSYANLQMKDESEQSYEELEQRIIKLEASMDIVINNITDIETGIMNIENSITNITNNVNELSNRVQMNTSDIAQLKSMDWEQV